MTVMGDKYSIGLTANGKQGVWLTTTRTHLICEFKTRKEAKHWLKVYGLKTGKQGK